eukprot:Hpha_TRINITY_DN14786_c0_g1::TRINITY_DN14786_c0_g1_i4::g.102370::m.102370
MPATPTPSLCGGGPVLGYPRSPLPPNPAGEGIARMIVMIYEGGGVNGLESPFRRKDGRVQRVFSEHSYRTCQESGGEASSGLLERRRKGKGREGGTAKKKKGRGGQR